MTSIPKTMFRPLQAWINRTHPLPERFYLKGFKDKPDENWSVWVTMEEMSDLYKATNLTWLSLKESQQLTSDYLYNADNIINGLQGAWLDGEERLMILERLGEPPIPCLPIYFITIENESEEKVVYIGITNNASRFGGGHRAALKLHHPKFNGSIKRIYRCSVWFFFDDEYKVIDWILPKELSLQLLKSIESQLIYFFQPELNTYKKAKNCALWNFVIQIQNSIGDGFLNDTFVFTK